MNKEFLFKSIKNMFLEERANGEQICIISKLEHLEKSLLESLSNEAIEIYKKMEKEKDRLSCLEQNLLIKFIIDIFIT